MLPDSDPPGSTGAFRAESGITPGKRRSLPGDTLGGPTAGETAPLAEGRARGFTLIELKQAYHRWAVVGNTRSLTFLYTSCAFHCMHACKVPRWVCAKTTNTYTVLRVVVLTRNQSHAQTWPLRALKKVVYTIEGGPLGRYSTQLATLRDDISRLSLPTSPAIRSCLERKLSAAMLRIRACM